MSYLHFDKSVLANMEQSMQMESICTSNTGAYSCTTVIGCNTRKYHGTFIVPSNIEGKTNLVLISSLDETIVQHGAEFHLSVHEFSGGTISPSGHKYMRDLNLERANTSVYRIGGVILERIKLLLRDEKRLIVRYRMLDSHGTATLKLSPVLAFRDVAELCVENSVANTSYKDIPHGISTRLYSEYPDLCMQLSKTNKFVSEPHWNKNYEYYKERDRGYYSKEDLFVPGAFEVNMKKGDVVYFTSGLEPMPAKNIEPAFENEYAARSQKKGYEDQMKRSARQFIRINNEGLFVIAGFPWHKCIARNMLISLPGLMCIDKGKEYVEQGLETVRKYFEPLFKGCSIDDCKESSLLEVDDPDVMLWYINAIQKYSEKYGRQEMWNRYGETAYKILDFILSKKHPKIELTDSGLLYIHAWQTPQTWMNARNAEGYPITPRSGFVVEINALWYSSLRFIADVMRELNQDDSAINLLENMANKVECSFTNTFWNGDYLYDFVDGDRLERSVRPNMLFAVSLPYSPIDNEKQKMVLDMVTRELRTPKGIRSLSPKSDNYHGLCVGDHLSRDYAAFMGSVYPWLMGAYIDAYLKIYKRSGYMFAQRAMLGFEEELICNTLGTLSEMYDGNPPFRGRGAMSYAMNVCEVLRALDVLKKYGESMSL